MDAQQVEQVKQATVTISDALIILSTLIGPVLAVQAQKWIERANADKDRKRRIFEIIMTTRGEQLSYDHKRALNQIDLVFAKDKEVINKWHAYFDHLNKTFRDDEASSMLQERQRRFVEMLKAMSSSVGYEVDDRTFESGYYTPQAHINLENDQDKIRRGIIAILEGRPLNMAVTDFPVDEEATKAIKDFHLAVADAVADDGSINVTVHAPPQPEPKPKASLRDLLSQPPSGKGD